MIYVLSGGGKKAVAAITVTFPAGSTVTATADGQTPRTYDDSTAKTGKWFIPLAAGELGTWTLNCTDGTQSANPQAVSITAEGQVETVKMSYVLYLLKDGVLATIGGTQLSLVIRSGNTQPTLQNGEISCQGTTSTNYPWRLTPAVDFTGYSTLVFKLKNVSQGNGSPRMLGASADEFTLGTYNQTALEVSTAVTTTGQTDYSEVTVPIENYQQAMYVGGKGSGEFYIDTIYLR